MNKIMIISAGSIHTFDKIKEAAEYKFKFLCHYKSDREVKDEYLALGLVLREIQCCGIDKGGVILALLL